jgi:predicted transcriptional regulator
VDSGKQWCAWLDNWVWTDKLTAILSCKPSFWRRLANMSTIFRLFRATPSRQLGPLEKQLLTVLWECGSATVRELLTRIDGNLAYTTVMTTLDRLYKKQLLDRRIEGRAFRYVPRHTPEELQKVEAGEAIREILASNRTSLPLSYFVEAITEHDAKLLDELQEMVERKRRELQNKESR